MAAQFIPTPGDKGNSFLSGMMEGIGAVGSVGELVMGMKKAALTNTLLESDIAARQQSMDLEQKKFDMSKELFSLQMQKGAQDIKTGEADLQGINMRNAITAEFGRRTAALNQQVLQNQADLSNLGVLDAKWESTEKKRMHNATTKALQDLSSQLRAKRDAITDPAARSAMDTSIAFAEAGDAAKAGEFMGLYGDLMNKAAELKAQRDQLAMQQQYHNAVIAQNWVEMAIKNPDGAEALMAVPGVMMSGMAPVLGQIAQSAKAGQLSGKNRDSYFDRLIQQRVDAGDAEGAAMFFMMKNNAPKNTTSDTVTDNSKWDQPRVIKNVHEQYNPETFSRVVQSFSDQIALKSGIDAKNTKDQIVAEEASQAAKDVAAMNNNAPIASTREEYERLRAQGAPVIIDAFTTPDTPVIRRKK